MEWLTEQVSLLTGVSASPELLRRLTYICYNHNENIVAIDTVRVRSLVIPRHPARAIAANWGAESTHAGLPLWHPLPSRDRRHAPARDGASSPLSVVFSCPNPCALMLSPSLFPRPQSLREAHDIGESLQNKVEALTEVERAFVHLDFETGHDPASEHKQWASMR